MENGGFKIRFNSKIIILVALIFCLLIGIASVSASNTDNQKTGTTADTAVSTIDDVNNNLLEMNIGSSDESYKPNFAFIEIKIDLSVLFAATLNMPYHLAAELFGSLILTSSKI